MDDAERYNRTLGRLAEGTILKEGRGRETDEENVGYGGREEDNTEGGQER